MTTTADNRAQFVRQLREVADLVERLALPVNFHFELMVPILGDFDDAMAVLRDVAARSGTAIVDGPHIGVRVKTESGGFYWLYKTRPDEVARYDAVQSYRDNVQPDNPQARSVAGEVVDETLALPAPIVHAVDSECDQYANISGCICGLRIAGDGHEDRMSCHIDDPDGFADGIYTPVDTCEPELPSPLYAAQLPEGSPVRTLAEMFAITEADMDQARTLAAKPAKCLWLVGCDKPRANPDPQQLLLCDEHAIPYKAVDATPSRLSEGAVLRVLGSWRSETKGGLPSWVAEHTNDYSDGDGFVELVVGTPGEVEQWAAHFGFGVTTITLPTGARALSRQVSHPELPGWDVMVSSAVDAFGRAVDR